MKSVSVLVQKLWPNLKFFNMYGVDQKVLKLVAYLLKYTMELHQTYTEYVATISWFVNIVTMT